MARILVELGGRILDWSTVTDSPVSDLMDPAELPAYLQREYGPEAVADLPARLARIAKQGTSSTTGTTKADLLAKNRAGPDEAHLATEAEIIAHYSGPASTPPRPAPG